MDRGKRGKKKKIKKKIPKIRLKQKKNSIVSKSKTQTKGNGLFQPFLKVYENFPWDTSDTLTFMLKLYRLFG